jgi:nitrogen fixation protein NifU and related proteins
MSELTDLYQELILDHYKNPRNCYRINEPTHKAEGHNPLCGDRVQIFLRLRDGVIEEISFEGNGCAISRASASLMTAQLKGMSVTEAQALFGKVHQMLTDGSGGEEALEELGKLAALSGVREFPVRVKCASLAWQTLRHALLSHKDAAKTE